MRNRSLLKISALLIIFLVSSAGFYSCTYEKIEYNPCSSTVPDSVSFQSDVLPLFRTHCSTPGCHSGSNPEGNLNLEDSKAYIQLSQPGKGYINLTKPEFSILYTQMNSTSQPMPPTGKLDECKINLILKWIQQGAKNN